MQIAILGAGRIGSTFAWRLGRAGHDVTVIARGKRLEELQRDPAITSVDDERVAVKVAAALDPATPYDLVLVTVLAHQVEPLLPSLKASSAKTVMFMFNTVAPLAPLRDAVGAERFAFGFPTIIAFFENGKLRSTVSSPGLETTVTSETWRKVFADAGFPAVVTDDMESWLRAHAAFVIPLMLAGCVVEPRKRGLSWAEAKPYAAAFVEGFSVVRHLGNKVIPSSVAMMERLPIGVAHFAIWASSRMSSVIDLGKMGPIEPVALIDGFTALAPDKTAALRAIRPEAKAQ
jgi:2-dehydropantoate 2-reductase